MFIYLILCSIFHFSTLTSIHKNKSNFLIESELKTLHFREGCLKTTRCSEPRFQLSLLSNNDQDAIRIDASINKNMKMSSKIRLSNFFSGQSVSTVTLSSMIMGKDPIFKIPVQCDFSSKIDIFEQSKLFSTNYLEISGKCYSAVIEVKRTNNDDYYYNKKINDIKNERNLTIPDKTLTNILNVIFVLILIITFMVISSSLTIIFMRDRRNDFLQGGVRINGDTNTFNDIKVPPYAIRELKKRSKSIYGCRRTKILSTIYESDDETPKRIPITSDEKKDFNNSQRVSILDRIKKDDNDKVSRWMEQGYTNTSSVLQSMSSYSSEKDSGMPGSSLNKDGTPSDCGTSLFGGVCGREDEIYIDVKNLRV